MIAPYRFGTQGGGVKRYTPQSYGATVAAGSMTPTAQSSAPTPSKPVADPNAGFLGGYVTPFTSALTGAVGAYGDIVGQDLRKQIGATLGNLNAIGGLRSGAVPAAIDTAMQTYGRQVGDYASMEADKALGMAQNENNLNIERNWRAKMYSDAQRRSKAAGIGGFLGKLAGLIPGVGGVVGSAAAGLVGDLIGG